MHVVIRVVFCLAIFLLPSTSEAGEYPFLGLEINTTISIEKQVRAGEEYSLAFRGQVMYFNNPTQDLELGFVYLGPSVSLTPAKVPGVSIWGSLQFVWARNQFASGDGFGPSLWLYFSLENRVSIFWEADLYVGRAEDDLTVYVYSFMRDHPLPWLYYGAQAEVVNDVVVGGPHVGVAKGPLNFSLQAFFGERGWTMRQFIWLSF